MSWLVSCYFVFFQFIYINGNWMAGMYVLAFFFTAWMALQTGDDHWYVLAAAALFAFVLLRVEAALFAAVFLVFLVLERGADWPRRRWPVIAMSLPGLLWCLCVAWIVGDAQGIVDRGRLLLMAGGLSTPLLLVAWLSRPSSRARVEWLQLASLAALALVFAAMLFDRPDHMREKSIFLIWNALVTGMWSMGWALPVALALNAPALGRVPHQRFVLCGVAAYLLLIFEMSYLAHGRLGWGDSFNRMLVHIHPTLVWILIAKAAAAVPSRPGTGATPQPAAPLG